ncbi:CRISPR-associated endonuclease Cas2 [Helicobacter enhydrae]|uniref:CRISPR-associated endoribonuclease Cas2 n=1 Tax=Helicobacter enhydrae TaxID=222136 RepID=A0A1B1U6R7_9HELI|nr:CRISPR-associated endonuclease Cas2 [Helicobacter enhydrae]ANV98494.1 CRISPR-associated endonuclease Cas2 [Helicobacter enhydrae]
MEEKFMRVLVMFDVPTKTKEERNMATKFRQKLIKEGYFMLQFSVYVRICKGIASANRYMERLQLFLPKRGHIRAIILTEKQFDHMRILMGEESKIEQARKPVQLTLF